MLAFFTMFFGQMSYWRHHCILFFFGSLIFFTSYFFIYKANQVERTMYAQAYHALQLKVKRLTQRISQQQSSKAKLCRELAFFSSQFISVQHEDMDDQLIDLVKKMELSLDQIQPFFHEEQPGWLLQLSGDYHQFLHFLDHLAQSFLPLSINYVEARSDAGRVAFVLRLILE